MDSDPLFYDEQRDSVSPLPVFCSTTCPPPSRCSHNTAAKQDFRRLTSHTTTAATPEPSVYSQSRRFGSTPLDLIPPDLYVHFPRLSTTTENLMPDFSTEEVTSTRLSLDEQDIVRATQSTRKFGETDRKLETGNRALHKVVSTPSLSMRHSTDMLRRAPSLRSEDASAKSGDGDPWWKGRGLVAFARKVKRGWDRLKHKP